MMVWSIKPGYSPEALGIVPMFLSDSDPRPAREQFAQNYVSGWSPMPGCTFDKATACMRYPGDPPFQAIAYVMLGDEMILLFESEFVGILQRDGSFECSRMD